MEERRPKSGGKRIEYGVQQLRSNEVDRRLRERESVYSVIESEEGQYHVAGKDNRQYRGADREICRRICIKRL